MITQEEIEQPRTPDQLRQFVAEVRKRVESDRNELKKARRMEGLYKMFVDEVIPLTLAADFLCGKEDRLIPVHGSQGYDVVVMDPVGNEIDKIEIAKPYDGKADADDLKLVEERGFGDIKIHTLGDGLSAVAAHILTTARKKSLKDYRDCTLLIAGVIAPPFDCEIEPLEAAAELLKVELQSIKYLAKRVILVVPPLDKCYVVQG